MLGVSTLKYEYTPDGKKKTTKSYRSTLRLSNSWQQHVRMEKLAENDFTYFYLRRVVIVVTAVTTISLTPVMI
jgi:hypothetical protein